MLRLVAARRFLGWTGTGMLAQCRRSPARPRHPPVGQRSASRPMPTHVARRASILKHARTSARRRTCAGSAQIHRQSGTTSTVRAWKIWLHAARVTERELRGGFSSGDARAVRAREEFDVMGASQRACARRVCWPLSSPLRTRSATAMPSMASRERPRRPDSFNLATPCARSCGHGADFPLRPHLARPDSTRARFQWC
jgi:hypothetical protein